MPKQTFYNLNLDKQERILDGVTEEFKKETFDEVTVKDIVERLDIARGSFYQYFESLEDAYYTILQREIEDINFVIMVTLKENDYQIDSFLENLNKKIGNLIFEESTYPLYKNWYLGWNGKMGKEIREFYSENTNRNYEMLDILPDEEFEKVLFIKAVVNSVIFRTFDEGWDKEKFSEVFVKNAEFIKNGLSFDQKY